MLIPAAWAKAIAEAMFPVSVTAFPVGAATPIPGRYVRSPSTGEPVGLDEYTRA